MLTKYAPVGICRLGCPCGLLIILSFGCVTTKDHHDSIPYSPVIRAQLLSELKIGTSKPEIKKYLELKKFDYFEYKYCNDIYFGQFSEKGGVLR